MIIDWAGPEQVGVPVQDRLEREVLLRKSDGEYAFVHYGMPDQRPLKRATPGKRRPHLENVEFHEGSMRPKVEACLQFVEAGGNLAAISKPERLGDALVGDAGIRSVDEH